MTTIRDIEDWLKTAKQKKATHLIVVCDTFDWDDYPVYVSTSENVKEKVSEYSGKSMQRVMEVYSVNKDWKEQLAKQRNFCYE